MVRTGLQHRWFAEHDWVMTREGTSTARRRTKAAAACITLVTVAACASGDIHQSPVAYQSTHPRTDPASASPLGRYRLAESRGGTLYVAVQESQVGAVTALICSGSTSDMRAYVVALRNDNKQNAGVYHDILGDRGYLIAAYCPSRQALYDLVVSEVAPNVVRLLPG